MCAAAVVMLSACRLAFLLRTLEPMLACTGHAEGTCAALSARQGYAGFLQKVHMSIHSNRDPAPAALQQDAGAANWARCPAAGSACAACQRSCTASSGPPYTALPNGAEANLEPDDELLAQLNMDAYDDEDAEDNTARIFGSGNPGMTFYKSNVQVRLLRAVPQQAPSWLSVPCCVLLTA